jgi:hypothetical protein
VSGETLQKDLKDSFMVNEAFGVPAIIVFVFHFDDASNKIPLGHP